MSKIKANNYCTIQGWMITDLNLSGNELIAYAVIYGFSQAEGQYMTCSQSYIAEWCNMTRPRLNELLIRMEKKGLIIKRKATGVKRAIQMWDYKTIIPEITETAENTDKNNTCSETEHVTTCSETEQVTCSETEQVTCSETEHHNNILDNNILDNHILSYQSISKEVKNRIEYNNLKNLECIDSDSLDEVVELMVDVLTSTAKSLRVNRENKPINVVKSRFMKLNYEHILGVLTTISHYTKEIKNPKATLRTMLYNAPETNNTQRTNKLVANGYL